MLDPYDGELAEPESGTERHAAFEGSLDDVPLPDVLQMLLALKKSGSLRLVQAGEQARILLRDGLIVGCSPWRSAARRGRPEPLKRRVEATVVEALSRAAGSFSFTPEPEKRAAVTRHGSDSGEPLSPVAVVLDAVRILDERAERTPPPLPRRGAAAKRARRTSAAELELRTSELADMRARSKARLEQARQRRQVPLRIGIGAAIVLAVALAAGWASGKRALAVHESIGQGAGARATAH